MRHIESWSCHNCHKRIHAWPCQYCGIGEDEHPDELALRNLSEEIAAKDAEIAELKRELEKAKGDHHKTKQDAATFRALAEKHIESLESKCAKMRELLGECREPLDELRICNEPVTGKDEWVENLRALVAKIDAILESEE